MSNQYDKVIVSKEKLTAIAENIRTQTKTTNLVTLDEMATMKLGTDTSNATATSDDILLGKTAYANDTELVGTIETYDGSSENGEYYETNLALNMIKMCEGQDVFYLFYKLNNIAKLLEDVTEPITLGTKSSSYLSTTQVCYNFKGCDSVTKLPKVIFKSGKYGSSSSGGVDILENFYGCKALESVDVEFDTYRGVSIDRTFYACTNLKEATIKSNYVFYGLKELFYGCEKLETINGNLSYISTLSISTGTTDMFKGCKNLKNISFSKIIADTNYAHITIGSGDGTGANDYGTLLTLESLLSVCNACEYNTYNNNLTIGSANVSKLENVYVKIVDETDTTYFPMEQCDPTDEGAMLVSDYMSMKNWTIA